MGKISLAILDKNIRYMENLAEYVSEHYRHRFNVMTFSEAALLAGCMQKGGSAADILLVAASEYGDWLAKLEFGMVAVLTDGAPGIAAGSPPPGGAGASHYGGVNSSPYGGAVCFNRYTVADRLVTDILRIYEKNGERQQDSTTVNGGHENKVLAVVSAEGGCGKTSFAIALCAQFTRLGLRTLYINLGFPGIEGMDIADPADFSETYDFANRGGANGRNNAKTNDGANSGVNGKTNVGANGSANNNSNGVANDGANGGSNGGTNGSAKTIAAARKRGGGLSDIIYAVKTRPERLGIKLDAMSRLAAGQGFYYYSPPVYPMDVDELQPSDIELLVAALRGAGLFDRVVVDTDRGFSFRNKALMELADSVFIVSGYDAARKRLMLYKDQIDRSLGEQSRYLYKRCHIILNRAPSGTATGAGSPMRANTPVKINGDSVLAASEPEMDAAISEIAEAFSAAVTAMPYCADMPGSYSPGLLAAASNEFGTVAAGIAHRA